MCVINLCIFITNEVNSLVFIFKFLVKYFYALLEFSKYFRYIFLNSIYEAI